MYVELDETEDLNEDCPFTIDDLRDLAKSYIDLFFLDKKDESGKSYEKEILHTKRNVSLVLNLNICQDLPKIYDSMQGNFNNNKKKGKIPGDIKFIMSELNSCARRCIPKPFATGIIAVLLEVCHGCKINAGCEGN